ncbi:MAG: hypothetical protein KJO04_03045, partial [Bacteroidia bacterium]|nr:hypothetical protein [Bacteroidia bacterium]
AIRTTVLVALSSLLLVYCTHDDTPLTTIIESDPEVGVSSDTLLVAKFESAPVFDGVIDEIWKETRPLVNTATVSPAGDRVITLNSINSGTDTSLEPTDLFDPFTGEAYNFSLRGGHDGEYLYLLLEWEDDSDSQDRESWYFKPDSQTWHQHNKYANYKNDKYYEDKFAMMFPIADASGNYPEGFQGSTCTITCHANLSDPQPGQKTTRHYMKNLGELADLWHWKRDRNVLSQSVDDGYIYDAIDKDQSTAAANGRKGDDGIKMYDDKPIFTDPVTGLFGPKWVKKDAEKYYWITLDELATGAAQSVTGVAVDGTLTLDDGSTINPNDDPVAYSEGFGLKRFPSITINPGGAGNDFRSDTQVRAQHIGTGWQLEIRRKLNSGDPTDAVFTIGESIPFGLAIFNNAAIAHGQTNFLTMTIEN